MSILKLFLSAILRFFWDRAEDWYQEELRYQENRRVILDAAKDIAREAAQNHDALVLERESIDNSILRLDRFRLKTEPVESSPTGPVRDPFGQAVRAREERVEAGDSTELPTLPPAESGSTDGDKGTERPSVESVDTGSDDSVPTT